MPATGRVSGRLPLARLEFVLGDERFGHAIVPRQALFVGGGPDEPDAQGGQTQEGAKRSTAALGRRRRFPVEIENGQAEPAHPGGSARK